MTALSPWIVAIFSSKLLLYIAYAMSVGGLAAAFMIQRYKPQHLPFLAYTLCGVILGLSVASLDFFLQVGSFSESGLAGMWDSSFIEILWQSGVGVSYKFRLAGWFGLLLLVTIMRLIPIYAKPLSFTALLVSLLISASFTMVGHTAEQETCVRLALVLHIFIAMWWVGLLYPLSHWCKEFPSNTLQLLMHEFGKQASVLVALLLMAGVGISYALEGNFKTLFTSIHGNILLLKIGVVAGILSLAAMHKFRLVPALKNRQSAMALRFSINVEMVVALLILIITAVLSTLFGPSHL
ncbi:copper resistance D family protein [Leucothrix pacifica]|uniref:Copper resistance protein D n=1 Tax=Leucothrix pacifica TaxID=1247513 RepID=A0A317C4W0_9GAMM|nr:CopD family protein [Leucothrix pacifica]PWQ92403.1 copper-binding protein [Leucothrix pacifica]